MKILEFIKKHLAILICLSIVGGLVNGHWFPMEYSKIICISALLIMIFPVFINLEFDKGFKEFTNSKKVVFLASVFNFILYPLIAFIIGLVFLKAYPAMWLGLILLSLIPTSGMTISWTYFTKGKISSVLSIVSISIIVAFLFLPFVIPVISGSIIGTTDLVVNRLVIVEKLFFIIIIPLLFGWVTRSLIIRKKGRDFFNKLKPVNSGISAIGVLTVSFLVMSLETTQNLITNPSILLIGTIPVLAFYGLIFIISHFAGNYFFDSEDAKAFFFGTAARYHVITLGIVLGTYQTYENLGLLTFIVTIGLAIQIPSLAFYAKYINNKSDRKSVEAADPGV